MKIYTDLIKLFCLKNKNYNTNLDKIIIHSGLAKNNKDKIFIKNVFESIEYISGQKPIFSKIKKSISNFKCKIGEIAGIYTTLRKIKMWEFYHKLICVVIPRIKEFKGIDEKSIDRFGNIHFGVNDISVFPDFYKEFKIGFNISIIIKNLKNNFKEFYKKINFPIK
ncbi:50S ribosomal protein L5 [Candidatus Carsonella ruddii]|uniref:50S ribosomal protein L5 n=1 Tax=Carsonella ruddii TaxID=114186 RepID=UPI003D9A9ECC